MSGRIYTVIGPSGAGKDTLLAELRRRRPDIHIARRVITRPGEAGGEDFEGVSRAEFHHRISTGAFALDWEAHGLCYGIPVTINDHLHRGAIVLFNGSRGALTSAISAFPDLQIIHISADPDVLAQRLSHRGRETEAQITQRLARSSYELPSGPRIYHVDNNGSLTDAIDGLMSILEPLSSSR